MHPIPALPPPLRRLLLPLLLAAALPVHAAQETGLPDWPAVRAPKENWEGAAAAVKTPAWATWLATRETQLAAWMARSPDDPTRAVGWLQDYIDASGRFLTWTPTTPPPPDPDSKLHAAWRAHVRIHNVEQIVEAARLYRLTGKPAYLEWARGQLNGYASNYAGLATQTGMRPARLFAQALDEAVYALPLLDAVRLLRPHVDAQTLSLWRDGLFVPMADLLKPSVKGYDNVSLWIAASLAAIADEFQLSELGSFALSGPQGLQGMLAQGVSADGYWYEMSLQYQDYVVRALGNWLYAAGLRSAGGLSGKTQAMAQIGERTRALMTSQLALRFTDGDAPALNDTQGLRKIPNTVLWSTLWRVLPTPVGLAAARNEQSWDTLLDPPPATVPESPLPPVVSHVVAGLDSVQLKADGWQALLRYGQKSATHAQQEALSYDLKFNNTWVFRDPGTVGYGSPLHINYFKRAHAHNAPLIDNDGQMPWPSEGRVLSFDPVSTKVEHPSYHRKHTVSRALRITGNTVEDTVEFALIGTTPKAVGLVFNTHCQPDYRTGAAPQAEDTLKKTGPFLYWTQRAQYAINKQVEIRLDCAGQKFTLNFEGSDLRMLYTATTQDTGNTPRKGFYLETLPVLKSSISLRIRADGG